MFERLQVWLCLSSAIGFWSACVAVAQDQATSLSTERKLCRAHQYSPAQCEDIEKFENSPGKVVFQNHCAACHEAGVSGAPATSRAKPCARSW